MSSDKRIVSLRSASTGDDEITFAKVKDTTRWECTTFIAPERERSSFAWNARTRQQT